LVRRNLRGRDFQVQCLDDQPGDLCAERVGVGIRRGSGMP